MQSRESAARETAVPWPVSTVAWGLLVAACCVALLAAGPVYDTNDDPAIVDLLSGASGKAYDAAYLGSPVSSVLRGLYAAFPAVPWYGVFIASCNALSAGLWGALIASCRPRPLPGLAATAGLLVGCSYLMLRVNFMAASFSLFLAGAAWLWRLQTERGEVRWRQAWLGAAMGLAHMTRPSLQWLLLFFALPCLCVSAGGRNIRRLLLVGAGAGALVLATSVGEHRRHAEPGARARAVFNRARSALVDIPRDPTPAALGAAGWSRGDYEMAVRFGMYDEELYRVERVRAFLAAARQAPWFERRAKTARLYLLGRFHLACLAALVCVLWCLRSDGSDREVARPPFAVRALVWAWVTAGILALVLTRFPPRAFVPLYLYIGALASLVPPPIPRAAPARPSGARITALGVVTALLCFVLVYWVADARAGRSRLEADLRELEAAAVVAGPDAIFVPAGSALETQYTAALAPPARRALPRTPPGGWVVTTPAFEDFLGAVGFAGGKAFMEGLAADRRVVFVVRRSRQTDAQWLVERINDRYAPGKRLTIEPLRGVPEGPGFLFFRIQGAADDSRSGVL
jgi:hypothetical protein